MTDGANGAKGRDEIRQKDRASSKYTAKKAASERLAAQRAAQQKAERRRNVLVAGGSTLGVIIVVVVIVVVGLVTKKNTTSSGSGNAVVGASSTVTNGISTAATSTLSQQSPDFSTVSGPPSTITGKPLTSGGKPEVLYVGAEYCPYCAATRWPLVVALTRFGTFSNLKTTYSSNTDQAGPHTPTLSFHGSSYTSQYINFTGVEQEDGVGKPLESLTSEQNQLFTSLGGGGYPFIDFGGKWIQKGSAFNPTLLKGMTPDDVAKVLADPNSKQGKTVQATADVFTAIICEMDGGKPSDVCTAPSVTAAEKAITGK